jgi:hypothetical protein
LLDSLRRMFDFKKILCCLIFIVYSYSLFSQCNIINNGGFEIRKSGVDQTTPNDYGQVRFLSVWEDDFKEKNCTDQTGYQFRRYPR